MGKQNMSEKFPNELLNYLNKYRLKAQYKLNHSFLGSNIESLGNNRKLQVVATFIEENGIFYIAKGKTNSIFQKEDSFSYNSTGILQNIIFHNTFRRLRKFSKTGVID
jgi:hypothetical protein